MVLNVCYHINKRNFKSPLICGGLFVQCLFPCAFLNPAAPIPWLTSKIDKFSKVPLHNKSNISLDICRWVLGTDFSSKILDIYGNQNKQSVSLILIKHSVALLWYVGLYTHQNTTCIFKYVCSPALEKTKI